MKTPGATRFLQPATTSNCVQEQRLVCCAHAQARYVPTQPRDASQWFWHESKNTLFSGDLASFITDARKRAETLEYIECTLKLSYIHCRRQEKKGVWNAESFCGCVLFMNFMNFTVGVSCS